MVALGALATASFSQYYWLQQDQWHPGDEWKEKNYEWSGEAAATVHFEQDNDTVADIWNDFHFYLYNPNGTIFVTQLPVGGPLGNMIWSQNVTGNGTQNVQIDFVANSPVEWIFPGGTFESILELDVQSNPNGSGQLWIGWEPSLVPEPSTFAALGIGVTGLLGLRRRRK